MMRLCLLLSLTIHLIIADKYQLCNYYDVTCNSPNKCQNIVEIDCQTGQRSNDNPKLIRLNSTHFLLDNSQGTPLSGIEVKLNECTLTDILNTNYVTKIKLLKESKLTNRSNISDLVIGIIGIVCVIMWIP